MTTLETLQEMLMHDLRLTREQVVPEAQLATLGVDSLGLVELMFQIEDRFHIQIPGDNPTDLHTVFDVSAYVEGLIAARRDAPRRRSATASQNPS